MSSGETTETHWGWTAAAFIPLLATLLFVLVLGVDLPIVDDWPMIPTLASSFDGTFDTAQIWRPHNEHIAVYPHLVILATAHLTGWNLHLQMLVSVGFMGGALLFLIRLLRRAGLPGWSLPLGSCFLFSLHAYENWLWACQIHVALATFGVVGAISVLASTRARPATMILAALLANVGSWSFLNGFLVWPVGYLLLLLRPFETRRARMIALAIWSVGLAASVGLPIQSLLGRESTVHPQWSTPVAMLWDFATLYLGAGLAGRLTDHDIQRLVGWIGQGAIAVGSLIVMLVRRKSPGTLSLMGLGLFSILSAYMIGAGRAVVQGLGTGVASRYATYAGLGWIFVLLLPALVGLRSTRVGRTICAAFAAIGIGVLLGTQGQDITVGRELSKDRNAAAVAFRTGTGITWEVLETACGNPQWLTQYLGEYLTHLRRLKLSLFRHASAAAPAPPHTPSLPEPKLEVARVDSRPVGRLEARGGVPGNVAYGILAVGPKEPPELRPQGKPMIFDATGSAIQVYEVIPGSIPSEGAVLYVFSVDRGGFVSQSVPGKIVFR